MLHNGETVIADLGNNLRLHIVALQHRGAGVIGAKAETAVGAALRGFRVIGAVSIFILHLIGQFLGKLGSAVIEIIDIFTKHISAAITVHSATGLTHCLSPMVAGIIGVLAGSSIEDDSYAFPVNASSIRILNISAQGSHTISGILRGAPYHERSGLFTDRADKGLMRDRGIRIKLVRAIHRTEPMLGGVVVVVLLSGHRRGGKQGNDEDKHKHQCRHALPMRLHAFVHIAVILHILVFGIKKPQSLTAENFASRFLLFRKRALQMQ